MFGTNNFNNIDWDGDGKDSLRDDLMTFDYLNRQNSATSSSNTDDIDADCQNNSVTGDELEKYREYLKQNESKKKNKETEAESPSFGKIIFMFLELLILFLTFISISFIKPMIWWILLSAEVLIALIVIYIKN